MTLKIATIQDIEQIQVAAKIAFYATYLPFIATQQVDFMYQMMYAQEALSQQMNQRGDVFILAVADDETLMGFASFQKNYAKQQTKLHKLYVLPQYQGQKLGKILLQAVEKMAAKEGEKSLILNVNRYNKAVGFYKNMGYTILREDDIDIGGGYYMNDYEMIKTL